MFYNRVAQSETTGGLDMAEFTIDGATYETDNLDDTQKRVIALYQKALSEEADRSSRWK